MSEPTTALTDYAMGVVALILAMRSAIGWRYAFLFTGIAAISGGVYHTAASTLVWRITVFSVGIATFCLIASAAAATLERRTARFVAALAGAQLVFYAIWMATHEAFVYVIADYGSGMLGVAILYAMAYPRMPDASKLILLGIFIAAIGAAVQASGFTIHPRFNHNDLYHVIQIGSLILLYRGARASPINLSTALESV